jgi:hypothetical protein
MKKLLSIAVLITALAVAGVAAAAPGNGATVVNDEYCYTSPTTITCWDLKTVATFPSAPSGNGSYHLNGTSQFTVSVLQTGCTYTTTDEFHVHFISNHGVDHTSSDRGTQTNSVVCADGSELTCTESFDMHVANGEVQFGRFESACTND